MRGGVISARRAWAAKRTFGVELQAKTLLIFAARGTRTARELRLIGNVQQSMRAPFGTGKGGKASAAAPAAEGEEEEVLPGAFK